jgi:hypothetical protein
METTTLAIIADCAVFCKQNLKNLWNRHNILYVVYLFISIEPKNGRKKGRQAYMGNAWAE